MREYEAKMNTKIVNDNSFKKIRNAQCESSMKPSSGLSCFLDSINLSENRRATGVSKRHSERLVMMSKIYNKRSPDSKWVENKQIN